MDYKKYAFFLVILLLSIQIVAFAQDETGKKSEKITQTLSWDAVSYANYYEVTIEKKTEGGEWESYDVQRTEENILNLHLAVGDYRYNVTVYNILNRAEPASDWYDFSVYRAVQPVVSQIFPNTIELNENGNGHIEVYADNLVFNSTYSLVHSNGEELFGAVINSKDGAVVLDFDEHRYQEGIYTLKVENPGGLVDSSQSFTVKKGAAYDIFVSGGYAVTDLFSGGSIQPQFLSTILPYGFMASLDCVSTKNPIGNFGFGASLGAIIVDQLSDDQKLSGNLFPLSITMAYNHVLVNEKLSYDIHAGIGVMMIHNLQIFDKNIARKEPLNALGITPSLGLSLQWFVGKDFFFDFALDYYCSFFINDSYLQMLSPSVAIGWKF